MSRCSPRSATCSPSRRRSRSHSTRCRTGAAAGAPVRQPLHQCRASHSPVRRLLPQDALVGVRLALLPLAPGTRVVLPGGAVPHRFWAAPGVDGAAVPARAAGLLSGGRGRACCRLVGGLLLGSGAGWLHLGRRLGWGAAHRVLLTAHCSPIGVGIVALGVLISISWSGSGL